MQVQLGNVLASTKHFTRKPVKNKRRRGEPGSMLTRKHATEPWTQARTLPSMNFTRRESESGGRLVRDINRRLSTTLLNLLSVRLTRKLYNCAQATALDRQKLPLTLLHAAHQPSARTLKLHVLCSAR